MRDEFVDTCGLCDAPLRMGQRCACGDNWRAAQPAPAQSAIITPDMAENGRSAQLEGYTMSSDAIRAHEMCADALRARAESEAGHG